MRHFYIARTGHYYFAVTLRVDGTGVMSCAPPRLPSQQVRLEGASIGQRHGVRAYGAYGRALPLGPLASGLAGAVGQ